MNDRVKPSTHNGPTFKGAFSGYPKDVLNHPRLTMDQKRSILAAWASDARAVQDLPGLRRLDNGAVVSINEILGALQLLDKAFAKAHEGDRRSARRLAIARPRWLPQRSRRDDDDDPPPCPAAMVPFKRAAEPCAA